MYLRSIPRALSLLATFCIVVATESTGAYAAPAAPASGTPGSTHGYAFKALPAQVLHSVFVSRATMATLTARRFDSAARTNGSGPSRAARTGYSPAAFAALKARALRGGLSRVAAFDLTQLDAQHPASALDAFIGRFEGLADSPTVCPGLGGPGCQPPDQAIAASKTAVVQAVNTSVAAYDAGSGRMRQGWPVEGNAFFGGGPGAAIKKCDPYGAFLSDPRAFYDVNDQRFFVSIGQFDAPGFNGPNDTCANLSLIWIAVSVDANPDDGFYAVALDASEGGQSLADYPRLGFDGSTVEVSTNSFSYATGNFTGSPMFYLSKYDLENGRLTTSRAFTISYDGLPLDTVQPVETLAAPGAQPGVLYNVVAFGFNFGGGSCVNGCNGVSLIGIVKPLSPQPILKGLRVSTPLYTLPPQANSESCSGCIDTGDSRISATPVYAALPGGGGRISWALDTAQGNATQIVAAALWGVIDTAPTNGKPAQNFSGRTLATGFLVANGDVATSYPATVLTDNGQRLTVVADVMGTFLYPSQVAYTFTEAGGARGPFLLHRGVAPDSIDSRWGDYSATSFDGSNAWVSGQYSSGGGDWATAFGELR